MDGGAGRNFAHSAACLRRDGRRHAPAMVSRGPARHPRNFRKLILDWVGGVQWVIALVLLLSCVSAGSVKRVSCAALMAGCCLAAGWLLAVCCVAAVGLLLAAACGCGWSLVCYVVGCCRLLQAAVGC